MLKKHIKEVLSPAQIGNSFELDFNEAARDDKGLSHLDRKFLNVLRSNICHKEDGHYEVPLPLKQESLKPPFTQSFLAPCIKEMAWDTVGTNLSPLST